MAALADLSSTVTLAASQQLNLDTGAIGGSGDLLFTGSAVSPQGAAMIFNVGSGGLAQFNLLTLTSLKSVPTSFYTQTPLGGGMLEKDDVFQIRTNGGNYAKILITAVSPSSVTLQFTTYGSAGGPGIATVQNNYSYLLPGQPNYGIAPGTIFIVTGFGLASATTVSSLEDSTVGLPLGLNGASISVTVNGVTTHPAFYYAIATQLAAVLPSSTPVGTGMITVNYNGGNASSPIVVVPSALGFITYSAGSGGVGLGNVTNNSTGAVFTYNNSTAPGDTIVLWGSGLGATVDSDTTFTTAPHAIDVPLQIYIGGLPAAIVYQGSSGYPGLNQINVIIPKGVQPGCGVSVVGVTGNVVSNIITIPHASAEGATCSDPVVGISASQLLTLGSDYNSGTLVLGHVTSTSTGAVNAAFGTFSRAHGASNASGVGVVSIGSCIVDSAATAASASMSTSSPLDPGKLTVTGPTGAQPVTEEGTGSYGAVLPAEFIPAQGGSFTFNGTGGTTAGTSVGAFSTTLNLGVPLVWSNMNSITAVNRAQGLSVTWTGGAPNTYVIIYGSSASALAGVNVSFTCFAPVALGQFAIPSYILNALPAGSGALSVEATTPLQSFFASGLDVGAAGGISGGLIGSVPYN
jgi:uncharacterized protein (TIGR03437 family)